MIATHIFILGLFLSVMWGIYFVYTVLDYRASRGKGYKVLVAAFRRLIVALCVFLLPFSLMFRTACVLLGVADEITSQIIFFALVGPNVVGCIFVVVSLRYD